MNLRTTFEKQIRNKKSEIRTLEIVLNAARASLQATQNALASLSNNKKHSTDDAVFRAGTTLEKVLNILRKSGKPMKVMPLLTALGKEQTPVNRQALVGTLGAYVRQRKVFIKTGPNTFGLLEWENHRTTQENNPPEDFGLK